MQIALKQAKEQEHSSHVMCWTLSLDSAAQCCSRLHCVVPELYGNRSQQEQGMLFPWQLPVIRSMSGWGFWSQAALNGCPYHVAFFRFPGHLPLH